MEASFEESFTLFEGGPFSRGKKPRKEKKLFSFLVSFFSSSLLRALEIFLEFPSYRLLSNV